MDANQFRIGNHVYDENGQIVKIEGIFSEKYSEIFNDRLQIKFSYRNDANHRICGAAIKPIRLSPNMLYLLGFEPAEDMGLFHKKFLISSKMISRFSLKQPVRMDRGFQINIGHFNYIEFEYLHQLQNLYFSFTGEELALF